MKHLPLFLACTLLGGGIAAAASVLTPSGIMAHPPKFDRQTVTALGIVSNVQVRPAGPGTVFTQYQLCDSMCVNVISPGAPKVANGRSATVNGTFYIFFMRGPVQAHDIIVAAS